MQIKKIVITRPDGTTTVLKSGDQETYAQLTKDERKWIAYIVDTEGHCKDRTLNVNGTHYKPHYTTNRKK